MPRSAACCWQGAGLLAEGSELLLEIVNPGIIGGVVLPVLGALPDSLIILSSLSVSQAEAQEAIAASLRAEEERRVWESQLSSNARDMDSLVAQQAMANQQVAAAAAESDKLRDELQKALHQGWQQPLQSP